MGIDEALASTGVCVAAVNMADTGDGQLQADDHLAKL
jgi:hypothetical protein